MRRQWLIWPLLPIHRAYLPSIDPHYHGPGEWWFYTAMWPGVLRGCMSAAHWLVSCQWLPAARRKHTPGNAQGLQLSQVGPRHRRARTAHASTSGIGSLVWRPRVPATSALPMNERLLTSSSDT